MSGGFVMDGILEQVQRKLEQVLEEATDLAVETVLAGWDRKTPLHFICVWPARAGRVGRQKRLTN
jgi:hypothetical protein